MKQEVNEGLALLRKPFEPHHISKLPKQAKWMTEAKGDYKNCDICGGYHHPKAVHLDYVGHAALTDRLLDCDPMWNWEPMALGEYGQPILDKNGGLWIRLTVCGVTRIGYGHADGKQGGDANKETIGDALRNAAMRFGAALDLWHKGDLHLKTDHEDNATIKITLDHKKTQRDYFYDINNAEDDLVIDGILEQLEAIELPEVIKDPIRDTAGNVKSQIENGIDRAPAKWGFINVEEAVEFAKHAGGQIDSLEGNDLQSWFIENDHKLKALDNTLTVQKYQTDEGTPYQRIVNKYNAKMKGN